MQADTREAVEDAGRRPTPVIDRFWFRSVYFTDPNGIMLEFAAWTKGFGPQDVAHEPAGAAAEV